VRPTTLTGTPEAPDFEPPPSMLMEPEAYAPPPGSGDGGEPAEAGGQPAAGKAARPRKNK
jgi:hypothetical protein